MVGGWRNKLDSQTENDPEDKFSDLLVFGYHCKLFRNDDQARYIDQNKHLIPWMGDESITIDRYDGRGLLHDLKPFEAPSGGYDRFENMTNEEKKVELLCDEERYLALTTDLVDERTRQEEEWKRLRLGMDADSTYHEVSFSYDQPEIGPQPAEESEKEVALQEDPELLQPFVAPPQLDLPTDIALPSNMKIHKIIEKTARFIASQGMQMEVIIKAKQANNPYFGFLSFDSPLYAYYRFILQSIRSGKYHPPAEQEEEEQQAEDDDTDGEDQYLHPLLSSRLNLAQPNLAPSIPSINYKPSEDCSYAKLVSQIKSKVIHPPSTVIPPETPATPNSAPLPPAETDPDVSECEVAPPLVTPAPEQQVIIDKMASYVAKNGRDFEAIVRSKGDPRFSFLNPIHCYYRYYQHKLSVYQELDSAPSKDAQPTLPTSSKPGVVSFSIKSREVETTPLEKSALPAEDTDDEDKKDCEEGNDCESQQVVEPPTESIRIPLPPSPGSSINGLQPKPLTNLAIQNMIKAEKIGKVPDAAAQTPSVDESPPTSPPLTTLDKCMQLERKRKAMAFLNRIQLGKKTTESVVVPQNENDGCVSDKERSPSPKSPLEPGQIDTADGSALEAETILEALENGKSEIGLSSDHKRKRLSSALAHKKSSRNTRSSDSDHEVSRRKYSRSDRRSKRKRRRSRSRDRSHRKHHRSKYRRRSSSSPGRKRHRSTSSSISESSSSSDRSSDYYSKRRKHSRHKSFTKKSRRRHSKSPGRSRHRRKSRHRARSTRSTSVSSTRSHSVVILSDGSNDKERSNIEATAANQESSQVHNES